MNMCFLRTDPWGISRLCFFVAMPFDVFSLFYVSDAQQSYPLVFDPYFYFLPFQ